MSCQTSELIKISNFYPYTRNSVRNDNFLVKTFPLTLPSLLFTVKATNVQKNKKINHITTPNASIIHILFLFDLLWQCRRHKPAIKKPHKYNSFLYDLSIHIFICHIIVVCHHFSFCRCFLSVLLPFSLLSQHKTSFFRYFYVWLSINFHVFSDLCINTNAKGNSSFSSLYTKLFEAGGGDDDTM